MLTVLLETTSVISLFSSYTHKLVVSNTAVSIAAFLLCGEYVVRSFLPSVFFQPCNHGLDFGHQPIM